MIFYRLSKFRPKGWAGIRRTTEQKIRKKFGTTIFLSGPRFSRKSTLKFVRVYERFSCLFLYRGCLRDSEMQALFIVLLMQYKMFLLIINFLFFITTFYCNTTVQYTITSIVENVPSRLLHTQVCSTN